jgi:hypothetical protein
MCNPQHDILRYCWKSLIYFHFFLIVWYLPVEAVSNHLLRLSRMKIGPILKSIYCRMMIKNFNERIFKIRNTNVIAVRNLVFIYVLAVSNHLLPHNWMVSFIMDLHKQKVMMTFTTVLVRSLSLIAWSIKDENEISHGSQISDLEYPLIKVLNHHTTVYWFQNWSNLHASQNNINANMVG